MFVSGMIGVTSAVFVSVIVLIGLLLPLLALISIVRNDFQGSDKLVWVLIVLFLPFLGSILYFLLGRSQRIKR